MSQPPSNFRQTLIQKLASRGVDEETIADSLAHVVKGERVKKTYGVDKHGKEQLTSVEVIITPKDAAQGALLYDALRGGDLGLAPREARRTHAVGDLHKRFAPPVDERIVPVQNFFQHPVPIESAPPPTDEGVPVLEAIAFQPPPEDGEF